jgi:hypothetical protein
MPRHGLVMMMMAALFYRVYINEFKSADLCLILAYILVFDLSLQHLLLFLMLLLMMDRQYQIAQRLPAHGMLLFATTS